MEAKKMAAQHAEKRAENAHRERKETGAKKALRSGKYHSGRHEPTHRPHPQPASPPAHPSPPPPPPPPPTPPPPGAPPGGPASRPDHRPDSGFSYSRPFFEELVDRALAHAKKLGATDAAAEASEGCGLSVS